MKLKVLNFYYKACLRTARDLIIFWVTKIWHTLLQFFLGNRSAAPLWTKKLSKLEKKACGQYRVSLEKDQIKGVEVRLPEQRGKQRLADIYVPVRLSRVRLDNASEELTLYQVLNETTGPLLVTGELGTGKSTLICYLLNRILLPFHFRLDPDLSQIGRWPANEWFPILINLENAKILDDLMSLDSKNPDLKQWLAKLMFLKFFENEQKPRPKAKKERPETPLSGENELTPQQQAQILLEKLLASGQTLIIVDGMERIKDPRNRSGFIRALNNFVKDYAPGKNLFLATALPGEAEYFHQWNHFALRSPTPTYQTKYDFLSRRMADPIQAESYARTLHDANERVRDVAANPLLLSILAFLLKAAEGASPEFLRKPFNRTYLYTRCLKQLWEKDRGAFDDAPPQWGQVKVILGKLAYEMLQKEQVYCKETDLNDEIKNVLKVDGNEVDVDMIGWEFTQRAGLLYSTNPISLFRKISGWQKTLNWLFFRRTGTDSDNQLSFLHFAFQEYFAYQHLSSTNPDYLVMLADPRWQEIVAMGLAENEDTPNLLLEFIQNYEHPYTVRFSSSSERKENIQKLMYDYERRLQKLKEQKALKGLSTPTHILIEIEDVEKEIQPLRAELDTLENENPELILPTELPQKEIPTQLLFLLARILREYQIKFKQDLDKYPLFQPAFNKARSAIINRIMEKFLNFTQWDWDSISRTDAIAAGELFGEEEWGRVDQIWQAEPGVNRQNVLKLCGKIGSDKGTKLLFQSLDEDNQALVEIAVCSLQNLIDKPDVAKTLLAILKSPTASQRQRRCAIEVMRASDNDDYIGELLDIAAAGAEETLVHLIQQATIEIGYHKFGNAISPKLLKYVLEPVESVRFNLVSTALVETDGIIVDSLISYLHSPEQNSFYWPVLEILGQMGTRLTGQRVAYSRFHKAIKHLLFSGKSEEIKLALLILGKIRPLDGAVQLLIALYPFSSVIASWQLIACLEKLPPDFTSFVTMVLKHLDAPDKDFWIRFAAQLTSSYLKHEKIYYKELSNPHV